MIPVAGSAYSYTYATLGKFFAWIIGWDLILEYLAAASAVAVGWGGYFNGLMENIGIHLSPALSTSPIHMAADHTLSFSGAYINLPAAILVAGLSALLVVGIRASATFNGIMVFLKLIVVVLVIVFGLQYIKPEHLTPFIPPNTGTFGQFGWSGVMRAAGVVFFAYIGFDAVSVAAQEARNPQRDMPIGILGSLLICTVLYMLMSLVITGMAPYAILNVPQPVAVAVEQAGGAAELAGAAGQSWRGVGIGHGGAGAAARPIAHLLCDVARWNAADLFRARSPDIPDALCLDHHHRRRRHASLCVPAARSAGRTGFHRNAGGVCSGEHQRDGFAPNRAPCASPVPHALHADLVPIGAILVCGAMMAHCRWTHGFV